MFILYIYILYYWLHTVKYSTVHCRGLEYSGSQILSGWQRRINWVLFCAPSFFYCCPFSCPQVYWPRCLSLPCPHSISPSDRFQCCCLCAASPAHLFGLVLLASKFLHIQLQSLIPEPNEKSLCSNWSPPEADVTEKRGQTGSLLSVWAPSTACPRLTLYCSENSACLGLGMVRGHRIFRGVHCHGLIHTKHLQIAIFHLAKCAWIFRRKAKGQNL